MMKLMSIEEARRELGRLLDEVGRTGEPIILTRRGTREAVLISADEFERLKGIEEAYARLSFRRALETISEAVDAAGLPPEVVDEAVRAARQPQPS
ncbi:MAG: type II toxin-antitoxin system Phd/YefM family antitoxin [Clostridia bacterium]|nr:type II toxin-antitoxin system Phd/YefM family antitoxin [Clostridia bacterium]